VQFSSSVVPRWGRTKLSDISHGPGAGLGHAPVLAALAATVRKIHRVLSLVLALAVRDGQLTRNLAPEVNLPRVGLTRARLPTAWFALAAPMVGARDAGLAYRSCDALAPACGSAGYSMSESGPLAGSVSSVSALRSAARLR
jgi:hypothetical protein